MIVRAGLAVSILVMFPSGHPEGNISTKLLGTDGSVLQTGTVVVPADAVSVNLLVAPEYNVLPAGQLFGFRDLEWSYSVGGAIINGEQRYTVEARAPFGVTADGVRAKLGVDRRDLPTEDISLVSAYLAFRSVVGELPLSTANDGGSTTLAVRDAIEAQAALALIPTMAVRVAASEDSGTNKFKRQDIDWNAVADALAGIIAAGIVAVLPTYDPLISATPLFILAPPGVDAFTGV